MLRGILDQFAQDLSGNLFGGIAILEFVIAAHLTFDPQADIFGPSDGLIERAGTDVKAATLDQNCRGGDVLPFAVGDDLRLAHLVDVSHRREGGAQINTEYDILHN
ncbi:MAG: hypothetical protein U0840_11170 [Gemmataceae bacterium]